MATTTSNVNSGPAQDRLRGLPGLLVGHEEFARAVSRLRQGQRVDFDAVVGSSPALLAAALSSQAPGRLLVVCPQGEHVDGFHEDLKLFHAGAPLRFPAWETSRSERRIQDDVFADRLSTLKNLAPRRRQPTGAEASAAGRGEAGEILVTSIQSLMQRVPAPEQIQAGTRILRVGERSPQEELIRWLVGHGFHRTTAVELPGEFAVRGGILDVFAPDWARAVRMEWFDEELESLREFETTSQRSTEVLESVELTMLPAGIAEDRTLIDYLPPHTWVLLLELEEMLEQARAFQRRLENPAEVLESGEVLRLLAPLTTATAASIGSGGPRTCSLPLETVERFSGEIGKVRDELDAAGADHQVFVVAQNEAEVQRLAEILGTTRLATQGRLHYPLGSLASGFRLRSDRVLVISGAELFSRGQVRRLPRRRLGKALDSFLDLQEGNLVVHLAHGIARYRGLSLLEKDGHKEEHLELEFHGGTRVYVPASKIDLVQKYVGGARARPTLSRIGGKTWVRQKQAAAHAVQDLAADMLSLQAERVSRIGIAFAADSEWQQEFDASFPYQETDDQLAAIESIKRDMMANRPMDRLLCGDVGFGKTEIAMRAAFKAIDSGYQVAVLVPTTILAEQHYQTFSQRMAEFPFDIARLSRFCGPGEQKEILSGLEAGRVDVVIGTHRLASKDVRFFNLGLVIIDEEQRFGVEVKERLKSLRSTVDVLTMTATPIPRTLHMSLVGVRDISNLESPPEDRVAVETRVTRFHPELIRHAILRELNRGGQVYFVHNRIEDIEQLAFRLQNIVPEATFAIGHGRMAEHELERVMVDFVAHKFDVLLATTIVESGLDIPNANTIFIDEAHRYGLADLHQLRGRVGRYKHRAYCYLLVDPARHLTPNAAKRLRAIEEFSDLGAGFALAMRDLEIRGAGNLLGTQQSGHIAAVGYELYCQLLETAVRQLKQLPPKPTVNVDIDLPGAAYLPDDFVPDLRMKIDLYRRLSRVENIQDLEELSREIQDRFGPMPEPVRRMLAIAELRIDAAVWVISAIFREGPYLVFRYGHRERIEQLARMRRGRLRVVDQVSAYLTIPASITSDEQLLGLAKSVLQSN